VTTVLVLLLLAVGGPAALALLARREGRTWQVATPLVFGALVLAVWQVACTGFGVPAILLPAPSVIAAAIVRHLPTLGVDFMQTVVRSVLPGWLMGSGAGLFAAIALDRSDFLRRGVLPLGSLVSAMPIVGIAPIMVMWFGFDWQSKAAVVVVMTFFPMLVNATAGLASTGAMERDLMHSYGAHYWQTLFKLRLPNALPFVFNALKLNSTLALIGAIVAEFFGTPIMGMGFRISTEVARMNLDVVWAEITLAAVVGSASFAALALIERAVTFWHPSFRE
jgi:NitT/TauT family transport system permease protein